MSGERRTMFARRILYAGYLLLVFGQVFSFTRAAGTGPIQREVYLDEAAMFRIAITFALLLALVVMQLLSALPTMSVRRSSHSQKATAFLIAVFAFSTLWSASPITGAFRVLQLSVATLWIWYLVLTWEEDRMSDLVWALCLPILIVAGANGLFAPGKLEVFEAGLIDYGYRFKDNAASHVAAIAASVSFAELVWPDHRKNTLKALVRLLVATVASIVFLSAAALALIQIGVIVTLIRTRKLASLLAVVCVILVVLMFFDPIHIGSVLLGGKDPILIRSLSSRVALYSVAVPFALDSPLWGYGFLGDALLADFTPALGWVPQNAHNGYLSMFLNAGVFGLASLVALIWFLYRDLDRIGASERRNVCQRQRFQFRLVLLLLFTGNMIESWAGDKFTLLWPLVAMLAVVPVRLPDDALTNKATRL